MVPPFRLKNLLLVAVIAALGGLVYLSSLTASPQKLKEEVYQMALEREMNVEFTVSEHAAAALYYTDEKDDHSFELYEKKGAVLREYVFSYGGSSTSIEESVRVFRLEKSGELVLFSMNRLGIAKIICHDGDIYHLAPESPFVLIIPSGGADIYDKEGNLIDLKQNEWYEITTID